jgi:hypothetical protein
MSVFEGFNNKHLVVAILLGLGISIVITMLFGFALTYSPSKVTTPEIIQPTATPVYKVNNTLNLTNTLTPVIFMNLLFPFGDGIDLFNGSIIFVVFFMFITILGFTFSRSTTYVGILILSGILFWFSPSYFGIIFMAVSGFIMIKFLFDMSVC